MANDTDDDRTQNYDPSTAPFVASLPGALGERYELLEVLGEGGMGEVLAARDTVLGREVAIKRMRSSKPPGIHVSRFMREAQIQGMLDHPSVPPVHELAQDERGLPFFVMKRLTGMTLHKILELLAAGDATTRAQFPQQRLLRAFVDVCLAVELAHTRSIVHRDLKPLNIMLGEFGEVYVIDWGAAKILEHFDAWAVRAASQADDATAPGTVIGTVRYMAPEQRSGDDVRPAADVYALGCILFEILTLQRVPQEGATAALYPSHVDPGVSPELDTLCATATATLPTARLESARQLADGLQRFLDGDRDVALRKKLAEGHYQRAARAALGRSNPDERQRVAIREAGHALALDPTNAHAAHLVGWLMLEPPELVPAELERELAAEARAQTKRQARLALGAYAALGSFIPHMIWAGVAKPLDLVALIAILGLLVAHAMIGMREIRFPAIAPAVSLSLSGILVFLLARMYSPFLLAPGIAAITGVVMMAGPMFRGRRMLVASIAVLVGAVVLPYLLELLGVFAPTMNVAADQLVLSRLALHLPAFQTGMGLTGFTIGFIAIATLLSWTIATRDADARRQLQIQAWQLRQLIPESALVRAPSVAG